MTLKKAIIIGSFEKSDFYEKESIMIFSEYIQNYINNIDDIQSDDYFSKMQFLVTKNHKIEFWITVNIEGDVDYIIMDYETEKYIYA